MASFDIVNYSLRPSKSIQRNIIFDGLRRLQGRLALSRQVYIGFGSIWFTDFVMAHKQMAIDDMISIEKDDVGYARAVFNQPYRTVVVKHGDSSEVLRTLLEDARADTRPWVVWLDYDSAFKDSIRSDLTTVVEQAPENSSLLVTIKARSGKYGKPHQRADRLKALFPGVVPEALTNDDFQDSVLGGKLAQFTLDLMKSVAANKSRPGGFIPAFKVAYRDSTPMITIGGMLPSPVNASAVSNFVAQMDWRCFPQKEIVAPHLTLREASVLQSQLPSNRPLTKDDVKNLGFDLADDQIEAFSTYYREYPAFAQVVS
jgi:hypothetical protein